MRACGHYSARAGADANDRVGGRFRLADRDALKHGQFIKQAVGASFERVPAWINRCVVDMSTQRLCGLIWLFI